MKKRVIGWDWYDEDRFLPVKDGVITEEVWDAVLRDVKEHGYLFTGEDQQEEPYCCPVMNDYRIARFSRRGFARIMALAHGETGEYDYAGYMEREFIAEKDKVLPDGKANYDERISDRTWELTVSRETFEIIIDNMYDKDAVEGGKLYYLPDELSSKTLVLPMRYDENEPCFWRSDKICFLEEGTERRALYSAVERIWAFDDVQEFEERKKAFEEEKGKYLFVERDPKEYAKEGKFVLLFIR